MQKLNELGITVNKKDNFSDWYTQIVEKAELADIRFGIQGFVVHRPWGYFIIKKIYEYLEQEVDKQGHKQFLFPIAVKEENLKKEKEHAGFTPNVFWVSEAGSTKLEERFALRPTGEAQIYPLYSIWLRSYKDLPFLGYQSRISVFRNEMTTRPFIRGREFLFFETHDVFYTHQEALQQIDKDLETCRKVIYDKIKIPFLYFKRPQWDKFKGADNTFTPETIMPDGKKIQLASTHDLGQNFSKAFNINVVGEDEKKRLVWQTCFGPGIWRIMAALIAIHGDDKGLVLPFDMAPLQVVIIPIIFSVSKEESDKIINEGKKIQLKIEELGFRVKFDDTNETPGFKYNKYELAGVPIRLEIGPKEIKSRSVTILLRTENKRITIKSTSMLKEIKKFAVKLDEEIQKKADIYFSNNTRNANTLKELKELVKKYKGFIKIPFCSIEKDGEECAKILKNKTDGVDVCGILYPKAEEPKSNHKCIICDKEANYIVYTSKSY